MEDYKKIGNNIRSLRLAYGESQEELGRILHVTKSAVSNYERGVRPQPHETIIAIAEHFGLTYEEFINSDFSTIGKINFDSTYIENNILTIFPIVSTENAIKNEIFRKAYESHKKGIYLAGRIDPKGPQMILDGFRLYIEAVEDERSKFEASANIIGLYYLFLVFYQAPSVLENNTWAIFSQLLSTRPKLKTYINEDNSSYKKNAEEIVIELQSSEWVEFISKCIKNIKRSNKWSDLADYYLALPYIFFLVDNGLSRIFNLKIGMEMLRIFSNIGNEYATKYLSLTINSITQ